MSKKSFKDNVKSYLSYIQCVRFGAPKTCRFYHNAIVCKNTVFENYVAINGPGVYRNCFIGKATYVAGNSYMENTRIGKFSSIGPNFNIYLGTHPSHSWISTHPAFYSPFFHANISFAEDQLFQELNYVDKESKIAVSIGNDVWVGANVSILENVTIGDGAIIAAGAVVTQNVPPYAIVGGIPAKLIRYRFPSNDIEWLNGLKWWDKDEDWLKNYAEYFDNLQRLREILNQE